MKYGVLVTVGPEEIKQQRNKSSQRSSSRQVAQTTSPRTGAYCPLKKHTAKSSYKKNIEHW